MGIRLDPELKAEKQQHKQPNKEAQLTNSDPYHTEDKDPSQKIKPNKKDKMTHHSCLLWSLYNVILIYIIQIIYILSILFLEKSTKHEPHIIPYSNLTKVKLLYPLIQTET